MKEITRIHIAKVAYDIELDAKKDIQKYISALEQYAEDQEILDDIEIRITELLAERGVAAGGVITGDDVVSVRMQLGEPRDFAPEDMGMVEEATEERKSYVYRDLDSALLGGVLAGIARRFGYDPLWVRLLFLVLLPISFGSGFLLYFASWLIIPPARTAAEKLRMQGKPVTLKAIKRLGETAIVDNKMTQHVRTVARYILGALLAIGGIGAFVTTVVVGFGAVVGVGMRGDGESWHAAWRMDAWWVVTGLVLYIMSGLLLAILCLILASAVFRKSWSKRFSVAVISVIAAGLLAFSGATGVVVYGSWQEVREMNESRQVSKVDLPEALKNIKTLRVAWDGQVHEQVTIEYIVSDKPRYELDGLSGIKSKITMSDDGSLATVSIESTNGQEYWGSYGAVLKIYGPALDTIETKEWIVKYDNPQGQDELTIIGESGLVTITGSYREVWASSKDQASISLDKAVVEDLNVKLVNGYVLAGVVRTLAVEQPDVCVARGGNERSRLLVQAVSSGEITYNSVKQPAKNTQNNCGKVVIGEYNEREEQ